MASRDDYDYYQLGRAPVPQPRMSDDDIRMLIRHLTLNSKARTPGLVRQIANELAGSVIEKGSPANLSETVGALDRRLANPGAELTSSLVNRFENAPKDPKSASVTPSFVPWNGRNQPVDPNLIDKALASGTLMGASQMAMPGISGLVGNLGVGAAMAGASGEDPTTGALLNGALGSPLKAAKYIGIPAAMAGIDEANAGPLSKLASKLAGSVGAQRVVRNPDALRNWMYATLQPEQAKELSRAGGQDLESYIRQNHPTMYDQFSQDWEPQKYAGGGSVLKTLKELAFPSMLRQSNIVKPEGGQWLTGSVMDALNPLKRPETQTAQIIDGRLVTQPSSNAALNKWIAGPLKRYVEQRMASPSDEIRQLADQGITHLPADHPVDSLTAQTHRKWADSMVRTPQLDSPGFILSTTPGGRTWEDAADAALSPHRVMDILDSEQQANPWLAKLDPSTPIYHANGETRFNNFPHQVGFYHILDILNNDLQSGALRPDNLNKLSVADAVRRTHDANVAAAKKMEQQRIADMEGIPVHKDYGDGMKWVELSPEGTSVGESATTEEAMAAHEKQKMLQRWLTQEGDSMGHCVDGYCDGVLSGRSRIFSLRDAKGHPHVTIEVDPQGGSYDDDGSFTGGAPTPSIIQIKGKQNAAPIDAYLPYVQDFVKSGQWGKVGDLQNTGLINVNGKYHDKGLVKQSAMYKLDPEHEASLGKSDYVPLQDAAKLYFPEDPKAQDTFMNGALESSYGIKLPDNFATGGSVPENEKPVHNNAWPFFVEEQQAHTSWPFFQDAA